MRSDDPKAQKILALTDGIVRNIANVESVKNPRLANTPFWLLWNTLSNSNQKLHKEG